MSWGVTNDQSDDQTGKLKTRSSDIKVTDTKVLSCVYVSTAKTRASNNNGSKNVKAMFASPICEPFSSENSECIRNYYFFCHDDVTLIRFSNIELYRK